MWPVVKKSLDTPDLRYSKLQYGISVWAIASKTRLRELTVRLNNIVCIITFSRNCSPMFILNLNKSLYLLKLTDIYKRELAKFMFALHNNSLPKFFSTRSPNWSLHITVTPDNRQKMFILSYELKKMSVKKLLIYYTGEGVYTCKY